jgi:hypothetical protein
MALCRCDQHSPDSKKYTNRVAPVGYPNTALVCGNSDCQYSGYIWLIDSEYIKYQNGHKIFSGPTNVAKMKAT